MSTPEEAQEGFPPLPEPEFRMVYFSYEGWNDWHTDGLADLAKEGHATRLAFSDDQMRAYVLADRAASHLPAERELEEARANERERCAVYREYYEADQLVSRIYDEVSPGLSGVPADHNSRLRNAIDRRAKAAAAIRSLGDQGGGG